MRVPASLALVFALASSNAAAALLMPPYLQALTPTSVYVMVECNSSDTVTVRYGADTSYGMTATSETVVLTTGSTFVHRVLLRGLSPNTLYHYSAGQAGGWSADSRFATAVPPGTPFRFAWMADCRTGSIIYDSVMTHVAASRPLLALYGGDLCADATYPTWKAEFFRAPQAAFGAVVPWVSAPGNHEGWTTNTQAFTHAPAGSRAQDYFSFECGDMHVLVLDTQFPVSSGSAQYAFADSDLAAARSVWKLVMLHMPAYCSGGHGEDADVIALVSGVLEKRGVDLVLAGHSHFYQHNVVHGIHHMVIGSAGAPLASPTTASYTVKSVMQYNWASCDITPTSLTLNVFNEKGDPLDTVNLSKPASAVSVSVPGLPAVPVLEQSYPNPFNPVTTIRYTLPRRSRVTLRVYDNLGRVVATLVDREVEAGVHEAIFDAGRYASGVYYYRMQAGPFVASKQLLLLR